MGRAYGSQISGFLKCNGLKPPASGGITKQKRAYGSTAFFNDVAPNCGLCNGLKPVVTKQKRAYGSAAFLMKLLLIADCATG